MSLLALAPADQVPEGTFTAQSDPESVVEAVLTLAGDEPVLAVVTDAPGRDAARAARLVLGATRLGIVEHVVPPTALFLSVAALRMIPPIALGLAPSVLDGIAQESSTVALLSSVTALERPRPSVAMDLASRLPGSVFRVDWGSQTIARESTLDLPSGVAVVTTSSERPVAEIGDVAAGATRLQLSTDGSFWGAKRWYEATVLRRTLEESVGARLSPSVVAATPRCLSCTRLVAGPHCVFCQIEVPTGTEHAHSGGHV